MLRIEVYPEIGTEDAESKEKKSKAELKDQNNDPNTYFSLKLKKKDELIKVETCLLDEQGKMYVVSGEDAYSIILRSYHKTEIFRNLNREEEDKKKELSKEEDSYFDSDVEYVDEDKLNLTKSK